MSETKWKIVPIELRRASDDEYAAMAAFSNILRAERLPNDPPVPQEEQVIGWRNIPSFVDVYVWNVYPAESSDLVGSAYIACANMEENRHLADFGIEVLPEYRRLGITNRVLPLIAEVAQREGRTLMMSSSGDRVPAGEAFLSRLGAERGLVGHTNQLDVAADLAPGLLTEWQERARERASGYHLEFHDGPMPDDELDTVIEMMNTVYNSMPRGDLQMDDMKVTREQIRQMEASGDARGSLRRKAFARETATGAYVGYTEISYHPNRPHLLGQGGTGVLAAHQGKGLGRWLKAALLERALNEWPDVRFVRTYNADQNAPMLSINQAMGFKPYISETAWQIPTEKVFAYLSAKG